MDMMVINNRVAGNTSYQSQAKPFEFFRAKLSIFDFFDLQFFKVFCNVFRGGID